MAENRAPRLTRRKIALFTPQNAWKTSFLGHFFFLHFFQKSAPPLKILSAWGRPLAVAPPPSKKILEKAQAKDLEAEILSHSNVSIVAL